MSEHSEPPARVRIRKDAGETTETTPLIDGVVRRTERWTQTSVLVAAAVVIVFSVVACYAFNGETLKLFAQTPVDTVFHSAGNCFVYEMRFGLGSAMWGLVNLYAYSLGIQGSVVVDHAGSAYTCCDTCENNGLETILNVNNSGGLTAAGANSPNLNTCVRLNPGSVSGGLQRNSQVRRS